VETAHVIARSTSRRGRGGRVAGAELVDRLARRRSPRYGRQERAIEILRDALHGDPGQATCASLMEIRQRGEQQEL
jgi:hypothetical protein